MVGSILYLTASRPNIMFATCLCARFQANLKESHLIAIKVDMLDNKLPPLTRKLIITIKTFHTKKMIYKWMNKWL